MRFVLVRTPSPYFCLLTRPVELSAAAFSSTRVSVAQFQSTVFVKVIAGMHNR